MTLPATVSITVAVVALLMSALALGFSAAPGWRELKYFAFCSALAGLYAACDVPMTLDLPAATIVWATRLSLTMAGLHAFAWLLYLAAQEQRSPTALERVLGGAGIFVAGAALVPGAIFTDLVVRHEVPLLGLAYTDVVPSGLGLACFAAHCVGLLFLISRFFLRWRARAPGAGAHMVGLTILLAAGVNDSLAAAEVTKLPYLLDLGYLSVVIAVGGVVTQRFVASAAALRESSSRLEQAQADLVRQERLAALGELAAVVAHEVRNPLAVIFNATAALRRGQAPAGESKELLVIVDEEANRLNRIVTDLLDLARPAEPRMEPAFLETVLAAAVHSAETAAEPGTKVQLEVLAPLPKLHVDEVLLRQALINLITNALQAPDREREVRVRAAAEPVGGVRFEVIDDGAGVPPDLAERIFTPFFTTRATGTGLGLAVVRRVAEAHRGTVSVQETPGGGATFVLRLPG